MERKTTVWIFQRQASDILYEKTWLRKGNHGEKTESLLIAAQNKGLISKNR